MKVKNENPLSLFAEVNLQTVSPVLLAYLQINQLKQLYRQGWLREGREIPEHQCESVADHCFGAIVLALLVIAKHQLTVDVGKVVIMIAVHEFGEVYDGDKTPYDNVSPDVRYAQEAASFRKILESLPEAKIYMGLWEEMEAGITAEAQLVRQLDPLEAALQALIYERQHSKDLEEFFPYTRKKLQLPYLLEILDAAEQYR